MSPFGRVYARAARRIRPTLRTTVRAGVVTAVVVAAVATSVQPAQAATASKLVFNTLHNATGGAAFGTQPVVTFEDSSNATVSSSATVTLSITAGTGASGAHLTCAPVAGSSGVASFSGCSIDKAGTGYTLTATSGSLTGVSGSFDVTVGTATQVAFVHQPASISAGSNFGVAPTVAVEDAGGNVVTSNTDAVGLATITGAGLGQLVCSGGETAAPPQNAPGYKVVATAGVAAFPSCTVQKASSTLYQLVAVATDGGSNTFVVKSSTFSVTAGTATQVAFSTNPTGATGGQAFTTQPKVAFEDSQGNVVTTRTDQVTLSVESGTGASGATLSCAPVSAVAGVATFSGCSIDKAGADYELHAAGGAFATTSALFTVGAGAAARLAFTTQPGNGTGGSALSTSPTVAVTDSGGSPVSGSVRLALSGGPAGAHLNCPNNPASAGTGTATFAGCTVDLAGTYRLVASDPDASGFSATSDPFTVSVGAAAKVGFVSAPAGGTGGSSFGTQPVVAVEDLGGNPVAVANESVRIALAAGTGPSGATLSCAADPLTTSTGTASFSNCAIDRVGSGYQLTATAHGFAVTSSAFDVSAGAAAKLVFSAAPVTSIAASPFGSQPQISIEDAGGNPVGGSGTSITLSASGPGTLQCAADPVSTVGGVASFAGCQLSTAGSYTLSASGGGLPTVTSGTFSVVGGTPLGVAPVGEPLGQSFGGMNYARNTTAVVDDVNSATGALVLSLTDLTVAGIGEPLALTRTYNSADVTGGSFGPGWSSIFDAGVQVAANGQTAVVRGEDGQQLVFVTNGSGGWAAPAGARASLACSGTTCTVTRFDGVVWHSRGGKIQDFLAPTGQGLHFVYSGSTLTGVTVALASSALQINVTVNGAGQVTAVTTPTRSVGYRYASGQLTGFTDASGRTWTYAYSGGLTQETDPLGQPRLQVAYSSGRVASASGMGSSTHFDDSYTWNATTQVSTRSARVVANGSSALGSYLDQYKNNVIVSQQQPDGATTAFSYDAQRNMIEFQDPLGRIQQLAYNSTGDLITQTVPYTPTAGATTRMTYDNAHHVLSSTDPNGNTTTNTYSGANLIQVTPPGSTTGATHYVYNNLGEQTEKDTPTGIETFTYDAAGNQTGFRLLDLHRAALNGLGPITSFNEAGQPLVEADARGHNSDGSTDPAYRTTNAYDAVGRLLSSTTPGPQTSTTTYTAAGDVASTTPAGKPTTTYSWSEANLTRSAVSSVGTDTSVYDASGNLRSETDTGGRTTSHVYDTSSREIARTDSHNITTTYSYDLSGNVIATADSVGHTGAFTYDPQHRIVRSVVNGVAATSSYDAAGNLVAQTDAAGRATTYTFTTHERMATVHAAAGTTAYTYDASDDVVSIRDGAGHTTLLSYNGAGQRTASTVGGHTTTYAYDVANNLTGVTDPDGRTTHYTVNAQDLRTNISYAQSGQSTISVTQTYNAAGQRTGMTDPTTGTHAYSYDSAGNMTSAVNGSDSFAWDYSAPGKVTETYPDGTHVATTYDDSHNVMNVQSGAVNVAYLRNTARQVTGIAYSNGIVETQAYNQAGQVISQSLSCAGTSQAVSGYAYDAAGDPLGTQTTVGATTTTSAYGYDASGRLSAQSTSSAGASTATTPSPSPACTTGAQSTPGAPQQNDGSGTTTATASTTANQPTTANGFTSSGTAANPISYDAVGNRLSANGTSFTYDSADRVLTQTGATSAAWHYDNAGNVTSIGTTTYGYDAAGRLSTVTTPSSTTSYAYDGDGNRVSEAVNVGSTTTTTLFSWDTSGPVALLVLERTSAKTLVRRYLYGATPVAMQTPTGTYYLHTDPHGSVTGLSDSTGAILATYAYDGFGNVTTNKIASTVPVMPLLWQSQYLDTATGLYDMRARNYDPTRGRFTQRDPLPTDVGVAAVSAYVFAADRPTVAGDPTGQTSVTDSALHGKSTESANAVNDAGYGVKVSKFLALKPVLAGLKEAGYIEEASAKSASDVGGKVLGVIGIGLALYVTVEDCEHGTVQQCVGDTVGVAISVACLAVSDGLGSVACGIAGAGIAYVISTYGPEIVQGLADLGAYEIEGFTIAIDAISTAFSQAGAELTGDYAVASSAVVGAYNTVATTLTGVFSGDGPIATGFEQAATAIASGYRSAVAALEQAGYTAIQMVTVLKGVFTEAANAVVTELVALGYDVDGVARALAGVFTETAAQVAAALKQFAYDVTEIATALKNALAEAAASAAAILQGLNYAVNTIASALKGVFSEIDSAVASILQGLNYAIDDIGSALKSAFADADQAVAQILQTLSFTLTQIAGALKNVFNDADAAVATALHALSATADQIASALQSIYGDADAAVATILQNVGFAVDVVAQTLTNVYNEAAQTVANVLKSIGDTASQIENVLSSVFGEAVGDIESVLGAIGFDNSTICAIGGAFTDFGNQVASAFEDAFSWL